MAASLTLVYVSANKLTYLLNNASTLDTSITLPAAGGTTPDLATDCANSAAAVASSGGRACCPRLRKVCRAGLDGLGTVAAGAWNQAKARDLLIGNGATSAGSALMPRALVSLRPNTGIGGGPLAEVDANVDGSGRPTLVFTMIAVAGNCLVDVVLQQSGANK